MRVPRLRPCVESTPSKDLFIYLRSVSSNGLLQLACELVSLYPIFGHPFLCFFRESVDNLH